ncbi:MULTISPECIES: hypothetical protein [Deinococcus]|uniref:SHOCT domain-containing protein n=1 Tax=Deinococcus rhizophilus TaxID=3049544 RepID=A0ABT7JDD8_9DEIO|nr:MULTISPECIES: hypothetical protein [Deinococcus]MDL2342572.1 hypothetical protein [Deinococcus rhizophilus]
MNPTPSPQHATLTSRERERERQRLRQQLERGEITPQQAEAALARLQPPPPLRG